MTMIAFGKKDDVALKGNRGTPNANILILDSKKVLKLDCRTGVE
jgi:hypothetical protein